MCLKGLAKYVLIAVTDVVVKGLSEEADTIKLNCVFKILVDLFNCLFV